MTEKLGWRQASSEQSRTTHSCGIKRGQGQRTAIRGRTTTVSRQQRNRSPAFSSGRPATVKSRVWSFLYHRDCDHNHVGLVLNLLETLGLTDAPLILEPLNAIDAARSVFRLRIEFLIS